MKNWGIYLGLLAVLLISFGAASVLPLSEHYSGMVALPGVGALIGALFQIARDAALFEKQKYLQTDQQVFSIGASSYMSTRAFDKHVEFCEAYMAEVHETIRVLLQEGPTKNANSCVQALFDLKKQYAAWIPRNVGSELEPFEDALTTIGTQTHLVEMLSEGDADKREQAVEESYNTFMNVMNLGKLKEGSAEHKEEIAVENVKEKIREILGINNLFEIRDFILSRSAEFARRQKAN